MDAGWWRVRMRGVIEPLMRYSADLAAIAALRGYGLIVRRKVDDATEWGVVSADVSADADSCLVVSPCLVVTDGVDALHASIISGTPTLWSPDGLRLSDQTGGGNRTISMTAGSEVLVIGSRANPGDGEIQLIARTHTLVAREDTGTGDALQVYFSAVASPSTSHYFLSCYDNGANRSGGLTGDAAGTGLRLVSAGAALELFATAGNVTVNAGGSAGTVTLQHDGAARFIGGPNETTVKGGDVALLADSGGYVVAGHDGDAAGLPIAQIERYNVLANVTVSSGSATAIAGLTAPVRASYRYRVRILLTHQRASATGTLSISFTTPSGAQGRFIVSGSGASGTGDSPNWGGTVSAASSTTRRATLIEGYLITDAAGDFVVNAARDAVNHTVYNGAWMTLEPLAQTGA